MEIALGIILEVVDDDGGSSEVEDLAREAHAADDGVELLNEEEVVLPWTLTEKLVIPATGTLVAVNAVEVQVA
eukprot:CAMPEP_0172208436 /NCGR_PEP_ID=MMETSP1050-20130122/34467_1 /TAXON_ID=233186 /ORGANISM="Cryptomonas curvata, Strain CCAP979/52" /LENGTH=72 /DNA_ID=CAMNT_0012888019 /DNA_START=134 /DNA_END=352 /DNA_ORIENTATION=+